MSGSSGGTQTTSSTSKLPTWAIPYAQQLLGLGSSTYFPGGTVGQMPQGMNQQVAGFSPDQQAAMSMIQQMAGQAPISNLPSTSQLPAGTVAPPAGQAAPPVSSIPTAVNANAPIPENPVAAAPTEPVSPITNPVTNPAPAPAPKKKKKS